MSILAKPATFMPMTTDTRPPEIPLAGLSTAQVALLRDNFALVEGQAAIAALVFYRHLFTLDPGLRPLFQSSIELQGRKLMEAMEYTLAALDRPEELVPVLEALGRRHVSYGTRTEHYATMTGAMILTLQETLGTGFTPACEEAWRTALGFIHLHMIRGAAGVTDLVRETSGKSNEPADPAAR